MRTIPFVTSDLELFGLVAAHVRRTPGLDAEATRIDNADDALGFMNIETPDLALVGLSDPAFDGFAVLDRIQQDPWLHHAGIIAFHADPEAGDRLEKMRGVNLIASLADHEIDRYLPRVLHIVGQNRRILSQRGVGLDLVPTLSGSFQLDNDAVEATCYANLLSNFLFNSNKVDGRGKLQVQVALVELLVNAVEHGNCGITYAEKSAWLEGGNMMRDLIAQKRQDPAVRDRRVRFEYTIAPERSSFLIADEGDGFDWRRLAADPPHDEAVDDPTDVFALHGRGIRVSRTYTQNLRYNEKGNEVRFEVEHQAGRPGAKPGLFDALAPTRVEPGEVVFREGEPGDFLYYIAAGRYDVVVGDAVLYTLSADDLLIGEMAFLLNNRRSATVRAATAGVLVRMSKKDFVEAIKAKPHYGLFLARLLARKLARLSPRPDGAS